MFRREPYARLEPILRAFDGDVLERHHVALGDATRIALTHGEVRVSFDLDFLGSDPAGFAAPRAAIREHGVGSLLDTERLERDFEALRVDDPERVLAGLRALASDLDVALEDPG